MSRRQLEEQGIEPLLDRFEGELGNHVKLVFDIDVKVVGFQKAGGLVQNSEQFPGRKPVVEVPSDPGLEAAKGIGAKGAAAVDVFFIDASDLGDVGMSRYLPAAWENESQVPIGVLRENLFKFVKFHAF